MALSNPTTSAVQTFAGITNENEFYSHHYLAEVFGKNIEARSQAWEAGEAVDPPKALGAFAQR